MIFSLGDSIPTDFIIFPPVGRVGQEDGEPLPGTLYEPRPDVNSQTHLCFPSSKLSPLSRSPHESKGCSLTNSTSEFHVLITSNCSGILPLILLASINALRGCVCSKPLTATM